MVRKKKKREEQKIFCFFCDRIFADEPTLIQHQKAKHFKCPTCHKKLSTAQGLSVHCVQVHKVTLETIPFAKPGRDSMELEIFGMAGVPEGMEPGADPAQDDEPDAKVARLDEGPGMSVPPSMIQGHLHPPSMGGPGGMHMYPPPNFPPPGFPQPPGAPPFLPPGFPFAPPGMPPPPQPGGMGMPPPAGSLLPGSFPPPPGMAPGSLPMEQRPPFMAPPGSLPPPGYGPPPGGQMPPRPPGGALFPIQSGPTKNAPPGGPPAPHSAPALFPISSQAPNPAANNHAPAAADGARPPQSYSAGPSGPAAPKPSAPGLPAQPPAAHGQPAAAPVPAQPTLPDNVDLVWREEDVSMEERRAMLPKYAAMMQRAANGSLPRAGSAQAPPQSW
ncbi:hypothetical protein WJX73_001877 [Symbiochloris irregularis]|uniref:C2H2-type domain-containing protein n=1 Tax=Symbiochloris irregularis TaxID=706552 RepID=A0AAW1NTH4_9CHLO